MDMSQADLLIVKDILRKHLPHQRVGVFVFGSRTQGKAKKYSDLDLCIMGDKALSLQKMEDLRNSFSESDLPYRVDIVVWAELDPDFRKIIAAQLKELKY